MTNSSVRRTTGYIARVCLRRLIFEVLYGNERKRTVYNTRGDDCTLSSFTQTIAIVAAAAVAAGFYCTASV